MGFPASSSSSSNRTQVLKRIRLRAQDQELASKILEAQKTSSVVSRIMAARGISDAEDIKNYLEPSLKEGLPNPWLLKGLKEACEMIALIRKKRGKIAICCDFDVDGLSGGALVHDFFNRIGISSKVFVPDRFTDGYGLNENVVREIAKNEFDLLLTIDFGTTNEKEIAIAKQLGLKTIVIDHHYVGTHTPNPDVFINPQQSECGFAGKILSAAGLAWYLIVGLRTALDFKDIDPRHYLDIACLGTICDMVPLTGANRVIAKRGLEYLSVTKRPGLAALKRVMGAKSQIGCGEVGFGIGPRLNAAGRILHGEAVIELLTTENGGRADEIASKLNQLNAERQDIEQRVKIRAIQLVESDGGAQEGVVVWNKDFHTGVIGIVAQRLVENYYRPSVVLGEDSEGIYKGSVRGIKGFNVVETLSLVSQHLMKFGGHEGAGGLSIEESKLPAFKAAWIEACAAKLKELECEPWVEADTEAVLDEVTLETVKELSGLAPFGMGNPSPQLLVKNLRVAEIKDIKSMHLKVVFSDGKRFLSGMFWRQTSHPALSLNARVNLVFRPESSTYQGNTELMANIQAVEGV